MDVNIVHRERPRARPNPQKRAAQAQARLQANSLIQSSSAELPSNIEGRLANSHIGSDLITARPYPDIRIPNYTTTIWKQIKTVGFLRFAQDVDKLNPTLVIDRPTMMGLWEHQIWKMLGVWQNKEESEEVYTEAQMEWIKQANQQADPTRGWARSNLRKYWQQRKRLAPNLDISAKTLMQEVEDEEEERWRASKAKK